MRLQQPKMCEGCGIKRANYGLLAESPEWKRRWCASCSQARHGVVNLSTHPRPARPRAARPPKKRRQKALAQGKPVAPTAMPPAEVHAARAQPSVAAARKCGPATVGAGSTQGRRRVPGTADEPPPLTGKRWRGVAGCENCPPMQVFTITAALFEPESGSDDEDGGDAEIKEELEEQQVGHDEHENEQVQEQEHEQEQDQEQDDDDDWL